MYIITSIYYIIVYDVYYYYYFSRFTYISGAIHNTGVHVDGAAENKNETIRYSKYI